jgi:lipoprotein-releasing system ATP-binding protein
MSPAGGKYNAGSSTPSEGSCSILCARVIQVDMGSPTTSPTPTPANPPDARLSPLGGIPHPIIQINGLRKEYATGRGSLVLFDGLSFEVAEGEILAIVGESGAGKSTLLHILGALDTPSSGDVYCASTPLRNLSPSQAASFRNREVGYVWQFHYLLPEFSAIENVAMPLLARGESRGRALKTASKWLEEVELTDRVNHRAGELSGGEQQRVSLARALVTEPKVLLADEPTGDLDSRTAGVVFDLIQRLHKTHRLTSVLVTHNADLASRCSRIIRLEKGRLEELAPRAN